MNRFVRDIALLPAAFALACAAVQPVDAAPSPSTASLLARMIANTDGVKSYTASVHADIALRTFPFLSPSLDGTLYHKEPSRNKIIFTSGLPFIAKQFSKVYPQVESPSRWMDVYEISTEGDADGATTLKLVPRKRGRIDHIDAKIDDKSAELISLRWNYSDGGYADLDDFYGNIQGHRLVTQQTGHVEVPHYTADLKSTFSNFRINVNIPDSVFLEN